MKTLLDDYQDGSAHFDLVFLDIFMSGILRCHQSYIVNMERIRMAEDDFLMASGARIPIRRRSGKAIRDTYFEYLLTRAELTRI